jgi:[ribosomal protein S18]-alanine N-acetyltransferase
MLIRPMTPEDCSELESLFEQVPGNVEPRAELGRELTRAWVACDPSSGRALGYALAWWVVDELELLALATLVEVRRQGVARRLLAQVVESVRAAGGRRITLEVARGNAAARALYDAAGFVTFNVRRGYYRSSGDDALEMELVLAR